MKVNLLPQSQPSTNVRCPSSDVTKDKLIKHWWNGLQRGPAKADGGGLVYMHGLAFRKTDIPLPCGWEIHMLLKCVTVEWVLSAQHPHRLANLSDCGTPRDQPRGHFIAGHITVLTNQWVMEWGILERTEKPVGLLIWQRWATQFKVL